MLYLSYIHVRALICRDLYISAGMPHVTVLRHGESEYNAGNRDIKVQCDGLADCCQITIQCRQ